MKFLGFVIGKDGGSESTVDTWMFEIKSLFSIGLLRFNGTSREAFHSHAFNCVSLVLKGCLREEFLDESKGVRFHADSEWIVTKRTDIHRVDSLGTTWVLTFRGPWHKTWVDVVEHKIAGVYDVRQMIHGRRVRALTRCYTRLSAAKVARSMAIPAPVRL